MATWELFRDGTKEQDLINVQYIDSANPFGDYVILQIEDNLGQKFDQFPYATEVEVTVTPEGGSQISKFVGFVVERRPIRLSHSMLQRSMWLMILSYAGHYKMNV